MQPLTTLNGPREPACIPTLDCTHTLTCAWKFALTLLEARRAVQEPAACAHAADDARSDTSVDYGASTWRTGDRQLTKYVETVNYCKVRYAPYKGARGQTLKTASSADKGYERTCMGERGLQPSPRNPTSRNGSTAAAAASTQQRAAGAASAAARAEAVQAAHLRPLTPIRFRGSTVHASRRRR